MSLCCLGGVFKARRSASSLRLAICSSVSFGSSSFVMLPILTRKTGVVRTVGRCIYCPPNKPAIQPLEVEHMVPRGLGGYYFLREASCQECRKITHGFEHDVINNMFWVLRVQRNVRGLKSKHPKIPVKIFTADGSVERIRIPPDEIPFGATFPIFKRALLFTNRGGNERDGMKLRYYVDQSRIASAKESGIHGMPSEIPVRSFVRMLCKIAHCTAIADFGIDAFEPLLPELILGKSYNYWRDLVGTEDEPFRCIPEEIHECETFTNGEMLLVKIQLFASIGAPVYHVITGRLREPLPQHNIAL